MPYVLCIRLYPKVSEHRSKMAQIQDVHCCRAYNGRLQKTTRYLLTMMDEWELLHIHVETLHRVKIISLMHVH